MKAIINGTKIPANHYEVWQVPEKIDHDKIPNWVKKSEAQGKIEIKETRGLLSLDTSPFEKLPKYPAVFIETKNGTVVVEQGSYLAKKKKLFGYEVIGLGGQDESN